MTVLFSAAFPQLPLLSYYLDNKDSYSKANVILHGKINCIILTQPTL